MFSLVQEIYILDLIATFSFASYGSYLAVRQKMDLLGIFTAGFFTALGGGVLRNLILRVDPIFFTDLNYLVVVSLSVPVSIVVYKYTYFKQLTFKKIALLFDSIGLVVFTILGSQIALEAGLSLGAVLFLATVTAVGGGVIRDVLLNKVPEIMYRDLYVSTVWLLTLLIWWGQIYLTEIWFVNLVLMFGILIRLLVVLKGVHLWRPGLINE